MSSNYNRKDHLYQRAKDEGYRSRAAYKLQEIQNSYKIIAPGFSVLDVGAWPGGWSQIALDYVGQSGSVTAVDLAEMEPIPDKRFTARTMDVRDYVEELVAEGANFDVVMSDMSTKLTGIKEVDQAGTVGCAELALYVAQQVLKPGGNFVVKVFKTPEIQAFVKTAQPLFNKIVRAELKSSRNTSNEFYVIGIGFKGSRAS